MSSNTHKVFDFEISQKSLTDSRLRLVVLYNFSRFIIGGRQPTGIRSITFTLFTFLENPGVFEGDIKLTRSQEYAINHDLGSSFGASKARRWSNAVVPYTMVSSISKNYFKIR